MKRTIRKLLPALLTIIVAGVVFCVFGNRNDPAEVSGISEELQNFGMGTPAETSVSKGLWVYVHGAVRYPGVYYLEDGARAFEAIEQAGGLTENALDGSLNLAMTLEDGQELYVPDQSMEGETALSSGKETDGRIDINTASREELMTLPGIGASKAEAILSYREKNRFSCIEDIMQVPGIKDSSFEKIRGRIRV